MPLAQPGHEIVLGAGNGITSTASDFGTRLSSSAIGPGKPGPRSNTPRLLSFIGSQAA